MYVNVKRISYTTTLRKKMWLYEITITYIHTTKPRIPNVQLISLSLQSRTAIIDDQRCWHNKLIYIYIDNKLTLRYILHVILKTIFSRRCVIIKLHLRPLLKTDPIIMYRWWQANKCSLFPDKQATKLTVFKSFENKWS